MKPNYFLFTTMLFLLNASISQAIAQADGCLQQSLGSHICDLTASSGPFNGLALQPINPVSLLTSTLHTPLEPIPHHPDPPIGSVNGPNALAVNEAALPDQRELLVRGTLEPLLLRSLTEHGGVIYLSFANGVIAAAELHNTLFAFNSPVKITLVAQPEWGELLPGGYLACRDRYLDEVPIRYMK